MAITRLNIWGSWANTGTFEPKAEFILGTVIIDLIGTFQMAVDLPGSENLHVDLEGTYATTLDLDGSVS